MKALELAELLSGYHLREDVAVCCLDEAAAELRRLAEVNAELLGALEKTVQPLELYNAYGWPDRAGVIYGAKTAIAKAKEHQ